MVETERNSAGWNNWNAARYVGLDRSTWSNDAQALWPPGTERIKVRLS